MKYTLTIDIPDHSGRIHVEPIQRLRQWLKIGLRSLGVRCIAIEEIDQQKNKPAADAAGKTS